MKRIFTMLLAACLIAPVMGVTAYAANDLVLIVLWTLATAENPSYLPMVVCFIMFFLNDMYGFFNWRRMARRQQADENA